MYLNKSSRANMHPKPLYSVVQGPLSSVAFAVAREAAEFDTDLLLATGMFLFYAIFLSLAYRETCRVKRMGIYAYNFQGLGFVFPHPKAMLWNLLLLAT